MGTIFEPLIRKCNAAVIESHGRAHHAARVDRRSWSSRCSQVDRRRLRTKGVVLIVYDL